MSRYFLFGFVFMSFEISHKIAGLEDIEVSLRLITSYILHFLFVLLKRFQTEIFYSSI